MVLFMKRLMAQVIDLMLGFLMIFAIFNFILPFLGGVIDNKIVLTVIGIVLLVGGYFAIQYPFMVNGQTIGKGFYGLKIVSTDEFRKQVTIAVIVQREILCKIMSCFFICAPLFLGKAGGHEEATHTKLILTKSK
jgi:uncharacterized RDD family membrane protein YckC